MNDDVWPSLSCHVIIIIIMDGNQSHRPRNVGFTPGWLADWLFIEISFHLQW
jgi:hypothetical protein